MRRVDGAKVTRLTLGDLDPCLWLAPSRDGVIGVQKSAEAIVVLPAPGRRAEQMEPIHTDAFALATRRRNGG